MAKKTGKTKKAAVRQTSLNVDNLTELLASFLKANPYSKVSNTKFEGRELLVIERPWDDSSMNLLIGPGNVKKLVAALNKVILPPRLSALWHSDTKDLEVIWTAFKLSDSAIDMAGRQFSFQYGTKTYACEFGTSSDRLLAIALSFVPIRGSDTNYRNLTSFEALETGRGGPIASRLDKPRSFWIRNIEWKEDEIVDLAYHLNFYMSYFDDKTAKMIVHPRSEVSNVKPQDRYMLGKFPSQIKAKIIDPNILHFWDAAHGADDQSKSFLYYYRLIEYASTTYIDKEARSTVRRLLGQPNVLDDVHALTEQLVLATQSTKQEDEQRIKHLLDDTVDKEKLWREIEKNLNLFTKETRFEGGFRLEPFVSGALKPEHLDLGKFAKHIKDIRNALSHGRDIRTQMVIIPTKNNFDQLQPWVTLMCVVAGQVILFKGIG